MTGNRKDRYSYRLGIELAILITLVFHLLFLGVIKLQPRGPAAPVAVDEPECVLLSPPDSREPWEHELIIWAELLDPTLLTLPNEERGFSVVRRKERVIPLRPAPAHEPRVVFAAENKFQTVDLTEDMAAPPVLISTSWVPEFPKPQPGPSPSVLPVAVVWKWSDGTLVDGMPVHTAEVIRQLADGAMPSAPTAIDVHYDGRSIRVLVSRSSGVRALDLLALADVRALLKPYIKYPASVAAAASLPALLSAEGGVKTVEVEWRLLPRSGESTG